MASPRQLELIPQRKQTAEERLIWIRTRLEGLQYRQQAREERRREQLKRRKARRTGGVPEFQAQVTLDELIARLAGTS